MQALKNCLGFTSQKKKNAMASFLVSKAGIEYRNLDPPAGKKADEIKTKGNLIVFSIVAVILQREVCHGLDNGPLHGTQPIH